MSNDLPETLLVFFALVFACVYGLFRSPAWLLAEKTAGQDKVKVLYHLDSNDPALAKYTMALNQ